MKSEILYRMAQEEWEYDNVKRNRACYLAALAFIIKKAEQGSSKVFFLKQDLGHGAMIRGVNISDFRTTLSDMQSILGEWFDPERVLCGMREATRDIDFANSHEDGYGYCMSVLHTHDLNSAIIPSLSELVYRIRQIIN